jgi:alpha-1,2-glucosyltransferase
VNAEHKGHSDPAFWAVIVLALLLGSAVIAHLHEFIGDEAVHAWQINMFLAGDYRIFEHVTVVPIYHATVAALATILGDGSREFLRIASLVLGLLAIPSFLVLARVWHPQEARVRTLQFVFLPWYFPLFFLIYTDMFSLAAVLLMIERTVNRSYKVAGLCALVAVFSRQPNLVWLAYAACLVALDGKGIRPELECLKEYLQRAWPLLAVGLLFLVFVVVNGGVAVGDVQQHEVGFNPTNVWFLLLVAFVLFLPYCLARAPSVLALLKTRLWILPLLLILYFMFDASFALTHQYNDASLSFYRHNLVLHAIYDHALLKVAAYVGIAWMVLVVAVDTFTEPANRALHLLLPFAILSVLPLPLVEQRYYLVALALYLAMRPPVAGKVTNITLACYLPAACFILYGISTMSFFL